MSVVASYVYRDAGGKPLARVDRVEPGWYGRGKEFLPYASDGKGGYCERPGLNGVKLPCYHLDEVRAAIDAGEAVYITEGEGKCDDLRAALRAKGLKAAVTTIQGGASAPMRRENVAALEGALRVVMLPDSDDAGRRAARSRSQRIADASPKCDVRIVDLYAERDEGSDVADWLNDGHSLDELLKLVDDAPRIIQSPMAAGEELAPSETSARASVRERQLDLVSLCDVEPENVEWLWSNRIPRGKVTLLVGDPGAGKSFLSLAIASAVTGGRPLPDDTKARPPSSVIAWSGEDGLEDTIRVRAESVGVNLARFHAIRGIVDAKRSRAPFALADVGLLAHAIHKRGDVSLVVVDPVAALLAGVDAHRDAEVRAALQPLADLAHETRVAVVAILHLRKAEAQRALYRVGGSIGFVGFSRSVLLAADNPGDGRRALAPLKANLSKLAAPVQYAIDAEGCFWWGSIAEELTAEHLLRTPLCDRGAALREAEQFYENALAEGSRPSSEVDEEAKTAGIAIAARRRARKSLGVIAERIGGLGADGKWMVRLKAPKTLKEGSEPLRPLARELFACASECIYVPTAPAQTHLEPVTNREP